MSNESPAAIRRRYARQGAHNAAVHECASGNPAAAIHLALGEPTIRDGAAIVGERESAWSRYVAGKASPTAGKVHGWICAAAHAGRPIVLRWTADGVSAEAAP